MCSQRVCACISPSIHRNAEHRMMRIRSFVCMYATIRSAGTPHYSPAVPVMTPTSAAIIKNLPSSAVSSGSSHTCRCSLCICSLPHLIDRKGGPAAADAGSAASTLAPAGEAEEAAASVTAATPGKEAAAGPSVELLAEAPSRQNAPMLPCLRSAVAPTRVRSNNGEPPAFLCSGARARDMAVGCCRLVEGAAAERPRRMLELRQPLRGAMGRHEATAFRPLSPAVLAAKARVEIKYVSKRKQIADDAFLLLPTAVSIFFSRSLTAPWRGRVRQYLPEEPHGEKRS